MTWLILWRTVAERQDRAGFEPDTWILMGGLAIATLAGDVIHGLAPAWLAGPVRAVTIVTWVTATLWIPPLIYFGLHRISHRPDMLHFAGVWWAFVFPLGMYSAATHAMAGETRTAFVDHGFAGVLLGRVGRVARRGRGRAAARPPRGLQPARIVIPADRNSSAARARMVIGSSRRQPPTGSTLTAASRRGGRFVSARRASSCWPAGVAASAVTVHLRRKNRSRRNSQGTTARRIGGRDDRHG